MEDFEIKMKALSLAMGHAEKIFIKYQYVPRIDFVSLPDDVELSNTARWRFEVLEQHHGQGEMIVTFDEDSVADSDGTEAGKLIDRIRSLETGQSEIANAVEVLMGAVNQLEWDAKR